jgi:sugar lactone lactonase YvrE
MRKRVGLALGAGLVLVLMYFLFWPVPIDPVAWDPPAMPPLTGVYQENNQLAVIERLGEGIGLGPEDLAFDAHGFLYTGMADGRILRFSPNASTPERFADTGGRPLGVAFDAQGSLIVADALKGLLAIAPDGTMQVLANEVNGRRINFADGLDIAADGTIFFSEASAKFAQDQFVLDLYEHRPNGRLLAYDPATKSTSVVLDKLYFANGVAVSPDQAFVLVAETGTYRVQRYWLPGPRKGEAEMFVENLPGMPDNIRSNGKDTFWVGLPMGPGARQVTDTVLPHPFLRKVLVRVPEALRPALPPSGYVLALDMNGRVQQTLQDPQGAFYTEITTAREHAGRLYLGSSSEDAIGRLPVR